MGSQVTRRVFRAEDPRVDRLMEPVASGRLECWAHGAAGLGSGSRKASALGACMCRLWESTGLEVCELLSVL